MVVHLILRMKLKMVMSVAIFGLLFAGCTYVINCIDHWLVANVDHEILRDIDIIEEDIKKLNSGRSDIQFKLPILLWWAPFSTTQGVKTCQDERKNYDCFFTHDRSHRQHTKTSAIFFYGTEFSPTDIPMPRRKGEDWALVHEESPKNNPLLSQNNVMNLFNHTATFRSASDMPLTLQYLENLQTITDETHFVPLAKKNSYISKEGLGLVAYIQSSCDTPSGRDEFVSELMKYVKVDSYGKCLNNRKLPENLQEPQKMKDPQLLDILAKYKFVLAIENAVCHDYITEKLWKVLQIGAVPLYYGAPNVQEWLPNEYSAILIEDFISAKDLAKHLIYLNNHDAEYSTYLRHKPSINESPFTRVTNEDLVKSLEDRPWGVTEEDQLSQGNFVDHFECLVCVRVARNLEMSTIGFGKMPYEAHEAHYGCPVPNHQNGGSLSKSSNRWWEHQWKQASYESQILTDMISENSVKLIKEGFYDKVLDLVREETHKALSED